MPEMQISIEQKLLTTSRETFKAQVEQSELERQEFLKRFPLDKWPEMALEQYAQGVETAADSFCSWVEFRTKNSGSIRGGSARKLIIYKQKNPLGWYFDKRAWPDEKKAWEDVRSGFIEALSKAEASDLIMTDKIDALQTGPALRLKTLYLYYPEKLLPIYSREHIYHFLRLLNVPEANENTWDVARLNLALMKALREIQGLEDWSNIELMNLLYDWAHPREAKRVVKIAPGEKARMWEDCLAGGFICVGWDEIGDLRNYESKETFFEDFREKLSATYNDHKPQIKRKANELWILMELEPGDLVVANKGLSKVLAIGEVIEPGYEWLPERNEYKHVVRVKWDTSYAQDIESQGHWGTVTVANVSHQLFKKLIENKGGAIPGTVSTTFPVDRTFIDIADALEWKRQVILYGPPGTGKTYTARRFAAWWLMRHMGDEALQLLNDDEQFSQLENKLTATQASRRVWWVVANPKEWSWDKLKHEGKVEYRRGRIQRNYPLVQQGDLVIGYQSNPDKRIVALARISKELFTIDDEQRIELEHVTEIASGLTYEELSKDPILSNSEPMRFRNQGTLFCLSGEESDYLLGIISEREPLLKKHLNVTDGIGTITRMTFHASYSYEDFIEGYRPVDSGTGNLALKLEDGLFKRVCREAQANPKKRYLVFIDEINRANVPKVFGEIITLLEKDKRGLVVTLPQSKEPFTIPPNIYILGTMNTADRSIKMLDTALRRRFSFIELMPDTKLLAGSKVGNLALDDFLDALNSRIASKAGREKQIGHSYLLDGSGTLSEEEFCRRFRQEILPLLQEYCYDDYSLLSEYIGKDLVNSEDQMLKLEVLNDTSSLIAALESEFAGSEEQE
jgi:5-methylcytosine-specific restriction protein B